MNSKGLGVAFFATGPDLGLIMYIFTTLEFPSHNFDFHLLTTSVNAKYYYEFQRDVPQALCFSVSNLVVILVSVT